METKTSIDWFNYLKSNKCSVYGYNVRDNITLVYGNGWYLKIKNKTGTNIITVDISAETALQLLKTA